ncbi:MAG TPA: aldehyde dehydrogenase family protein [Agitococcus sp.]|nr:aldehyde dehydrogenase family protein [Agitococcus sp.]HMX99540.1 aldehyde dehydrogenase family protein [Agitococcus sp.]HMY27815.1 aldehyde dehydrogenase family protein [Agitococcus sp.]HMY82264.1 aldehyde dehydrogenase family protein [Agitococcus sp.]HNA21897.1 aldehyde dehydrogenase family protein [Agitococcus sp.]
MTAMFTIQEADPQQIQNVFALQQATAIRWRESTAEQRIARLKSLRDAVLAHRDAFYQAFAKDYRKPSAEVDVTELMPVLDEIRHATGRLKQWMKPEKVKPTSLMLTTSAWIEYQPRGRVLIIAPWNYPLNLCFGPLVSALAAGNTAIIKPSEMMPNVSAVMAKIIQETFTPQEVALFEGSLPTAEALLALPFDHIFFTGSPMVGKVVMAAAAKNLTSVTLELGGKSPTIIDQSANLQVAAETLMWGKFLNNGQTCVAPDHIYVHQAVKDAFVAECRKVIHARYGATAGEQKMNPDLTRIVNTRHTQRIANLLNEAVELGAKITVGGQTDIESCYIAPTIVENIPTQAKIMSEEIFGPVLPIISFEHIDTVIAEINANPKPLALYIWSYNEENIEKVVSRTSSGGVCINHCLMQFVHGNLPFGGVNNSGIGNSHGHFGFKAFSHERAVVKASKLMMVRLFFPPYDESRRKVIKMTVDSMKWPML